MAPDLALANLSDADSKIWKVHTELSSDDFLAIEAAKKALATERPDWQQYNISVIETDTHLLVQFWQASDESTINWSPNPSEKNIQHFRHHALIVRLAKDTLAIVNTMNER